MILHLVVGLLFFTVVAMLGGNPLHDRFGFRYWYGRFITEIVKCANVASPLYAL